MRTLTNYYRLIGRGIPGVSFSLVENFSVWPPPGKNPPGPHVKDQELKPGPPTPRATALIITICVWVVQDVRNTC